MRSFLKPVTAALPALLFAVGCGTQEDVPPVAAKNVTAPADSTSEPDAAPAQPPRSANKPARRVVKYRPPFPQRTELFVPPSTRRRVTRRNNSDFDQSVELMGFATVGEPHVVLSIDGVVAPVPQGSKMSGVQVISIEPQVSAVLQRGRNRWTATLE